MNLPPEGQKALVEELLLHLLTPQEHDNFQNLNEKNSLCDYFGDIVDHCKQSTEASIDTHQIRQISPPPPLQHLTHTLTVHSSSYSRTLEGVREWVTVLSLGGLSIKAFVSVDSQYYDYTYLYFEAWRREEKGREGEHGKEEGGGRCG
mmetsp:Transcript_32994/g.51579  ORF Transcript_32994/g.51579 Transcript_32994/m.51579 type:complete len:148 (-) Transcript_32994:2-445(-)